MEYNITTIIQAVFALIAAVITVIVIPYIKSKLIYLTQSLT